MSKILKGLTESTHKKYDNNRTGFSRGPRDDERHDLDVQKPTKEEWALKINGKVWSKDGKTVTFTSKERALKARQSLLAKRPELEVGLVTRNVAEGMMPLGGNSTSTDRRKVMDLLQVYYKSMGGDFWEWFNQPGNKEFFAKRAEVSPDSAYEVVDSINWGQHPQEEWPEDDEEQLDELSNEKLAQYKTAAAADAGKADLAGDYKKADKRFSGIVKATKKQFANDTKTVKEDINIIYSEAKSLLTQLDENTQQRVINALQKKVDDEQPVEPFKTGYPRVNNPQILGTQNRAKSIYHPPSKPNVKKLDKPLPENLGNELKSKSLEALQQVKQQLEQQRMADLEQWEQDFKQNTVSKFTAREPNLRQRATSTPMVAMPGEKHSELKARLGQLNKAIEKQGILDNLVQKLDKKGLLTPNIEAGVDTSMLARDGARDNYVELNKKLDKALEYVKNRLLTNKAAYAKPKAIDEDDSAPTRMRMNDYYELADAIQEKLRHAIQMGDKARIQELNKQRDELDAHVKKHGMMPEDIAEEQLDELSCWSGYHRVAGTKAGFPGSCAKNKTNEQELDEIDRRGFLKGLGAAAVAGAAGGAKADWEKEPDYVDPMDDSVIKKWKNVSTDGRATLRFLTTNGKNRQLTLVRNGGYWKPSDGIGSRPDSGRIRIDNNPVMNMLFLWASGPANIVLVGGPDGGFGTPAYEKMTDALLSAQSRILIDASSIGGGILEFRPNVKESVEQGVAEGELDEACWDTHKQVGMKNKGGKQVPNCVPKESVEEQHSKSCPHCGGEMVSEELMNEKKDACYYKVKSRYKVWPSAYASGALVKCRKKGASNWGNGGKKNEGVAEDQLDEKWTKKYKDSINCSNPKGFSQKAHCAGKQKNESSILEGINRADESLHDWFNKEKWVRMDTKGKIKGPCAREPGEGKPKCLPQSKAYSLGKKGRASAAQRKRREDPNPERSGKAINVNTKKQSNENVDEGWKQKLGAAALTGAMALGAAGANARVTPGDDPNINRLTGKPNITQPVQTQTPTKAEAPKGFSKEYLQSVVNGTHPRPMISVEKAQELLKQGQ